MKKIFVLLILLIGVGFIQTSSAADPELMKAVGLTYNAQFAEAESVLNAYIAAHPDDPMGYMVRGTNNKWKQATLGLKHSLDQKILDDYEKANITAFRLWDKDQDNIDKTVNLGNTYMYLANQWLDMGKKSRAGLILKKCQKHMEDVIKKDPNRYDAYLAIGIFNFYASNIPSGLQFLASILGISGDEAKGLQQIQVAAQNENILKADALFVLAYAMAVTKKNYAAALPYIDQLITNYPNNPFFKYKKGEFGCKSRHYAEAVESFNQFRQYCASIGGCPKGYDFITHYYYGQALVEQKKFAEALPEVQAALAVDEGDYPSATVNLHLYLVFIYKSQGNMEEAQKEFKKVESIKSKNQAAFDRAKKAMDQNIYP